MPRDENGKIAQESLIGDNVARGGDLFRLNCASCHNFTGKGGALSSGKYAPDLGDAKPATDLHRDADRPAEHAEVLRPAAVTGREARHRRLRPGIGGRHPAKAATASAGFGPAPEGMAAWIIGIVAVIGMALWIGARA